MDVSSALLKMIEEVTNAKTDREAFFSLLVPLLHLFEMDQSALCEVVQGKVVPVFAIDRSKKILTPKEDEIWFSHTLIKQAFTQMQPVVRTASYNEELFTDGVPPSVNEYSLRSFICIPLSRSPDRVLFLASQRDPKRKFSEEEIERLQTATKAAVLALHQHHSVQSLREDNQNLLRELSNQKSEIIFADESMQKILSDVKRVSPFNISIFIHGESGVGKEEIAKEIHRYSGRKGRFVAINCANLTETLLESELFGYVKGAFTGASQSKSGLLQEGNGGTIFLDEIGDLPYGLQAKLLRVIQERKVRPLGATKDIDIDVRFLAASHKQLPELIREKKFREDLFYRIQETAIEVPPLWQRPADIVVLAKHFVRKFSREFQLESKVISEEGMNKLSSYYWPGNVRELKNSCRMAVILSDGDKIQPENFTLQPRMQTKAEQVSHKVGKQEGEELHSNYASEESSTCGQSKEGEKINDGSDRLDTKAFQFHISKPSQGLRQISSQFERKFIEHLLAQPNASQSSVAKDLGVSVRTIQRAMNRLDA